MGACVSSGGSARVHDISIVDRSRAPPTAATTSIAPTKAPAAGGTANGTGSVNRRAGANAGGAHHRVGSFSSIRPPLVPIETPTNATAELKRPDAAAGADAQLPHVTDSFGNVVVPHTTATASNTTASVPVAKPGDRVSLSLSSFAKPTATTGGAAGNRVPLASAAAAAVPEDPRVLAHRRAQQQHIANEMDEFGFLRPRSVQEMGRLTAAVTERTAREWIRFQHWKTALTTDAAAGAPANGFMDFTTHTAALHASQTAAASGGDVKQPLPAAAAVVGDEKSDNSAFRCAIDSLPIAVRQRITEWVIADGVPTDLRSDVWSWALGVVPYRTATERGGVQPPYRELCRTASKWDKQIDLDVNRTFGHHPYLGSERGRATLRQILHCYSLVSGVDVGYVQGMNYIVAVLLLVQRSGPGGGDDAAGVNGETVFWVFCTYMHRFRMSRFYPHMLRLLSQHMSRFDEYVRLMLPSLHLHMVTSDVSAVLYSSPYWLTLFVYNAPVPIVVRIWDAFFLLADGPEFVFRLGLSYMTMQLPHLLTYDFHDITHCLQNLRVVRRPAVKPKPAVRPPSAGTGSRRRLFAAAGGTAAAPNGNGTESIPVTAAWDDDVSNIADDPSDQPTVDGIGSPVRKNTNAAATPGTEAGAAPSSSPDGVDVSEWLQRAMDLNLRPLDELLRNPPATIPPPAPVVLSAIPIQPRPPANGGGSAASATAAQASSAAKKDGCSIM